MNELKMKFISQEDLLNAGCFNVKQACEVAEKVLISYSKGRALYPDKVVQIFDETTQDRINCLPATLLDEKICGMKWVSVFPNNPKNFGAKNLSAVILLSNTVNGYPIALLEGELCSNMRTAAVSAVAAKYFAKKELDTIGFIGAGEQAKMHCVFLLKLFPQIKHCKVASRTHQSEQKFTVEMEKIFPNVKFEACQSDFEKSARDSDIIITATSAQVQILQSEWIKKGALYLHVGGLEDDYSVALKADKILCDNWEHAKHRTQTISRLYKAGKLKDSDIYGDLSDIVSGKKTGRENEEEFIYFNSVGLSYVDVALAHSFYQKTCVANLGTEVTLQSRELFEYDLRKYIT